MKQSKAIIGLIGGSGVGKGVFSETAQSLGYKVIDGDKIGHEVLQNEGFNDLVKAFGEGILEDGRISRKKLGSIVFNDENELLKLNNIVHGHICAIIKSLMTKKCVIDAAVLHKTDLIKECTHVVAVTASEEVRVKRIMARDGIDEVKAKSRIKAQPTNEEYEKEADIVLVNNGEKEEFMEKVKECLKRI